jgi:hypothetical protein
MKQCELNITGGTARPQDLDESIGRRMDQKLRALEASLSSFLSYYLHSILRLHLYPKMEATCSSKC